MGLIALDWGTSALRAWRLDERGDVIEHRDAPHGIMALPAGGFEAAYAAVTAGWPSGPAIACGMVGSAQGWREVAYVACPSDGRALAGSLDRAGPVAIVPGLRCDEGRPDVMRGEETQIVGALAVRPDLADRALLVLPGTHGKWARIAQGSTLGFTTAMTGEVFAALRDHTILGRPSRDLGPDAPPPAPAAAEAAFTLGLETACGATDGVAPLLFSARTLVLTGRIAAAASLDYLSGLLIGDEIRTGLRAWRAHGQPPVALIGAPALCARYAAGLALLGGVDAPVIEAATLAGLRRIAADAGLGADVSDARTTR